MELLIGAEGSGKTSTCYRQIGQALEEKSFAPLIMLVPEQFNLEAQSALCHRFYPGLLRVEVLDFTRLARHVVKEASNSGLTCIDDLERVMILRKLLDQHQEELTFFNKNKPSSGFIEALNTFLITLEQNDLGYDTLAELTAGDDLQAVFGAKLADLQKIYKWFFEEIQNRFTTTEKTLQLAEKLIPDSAYLQEAQIWVDGFYGFTGNQLNLLTALAKKVKRLVVTLPLEHAEMLTQNLSQAHPFYESIKMAHLLEARCQEAQLPWVVIGTLPNDKKTENPSLAYLRANYLVSYTKPYTVPQESVYTTIYRNQLEEVEQVAQKICALVREEGYRYRDIAVMVGDIGAYQSTFAYLLKQYEIPYFLDQKKAIHTHSFIHFILGVFEVFKNDWSYKSVMQLLRTGFFKVERDSVDKLENYLLAAGIRGEKKWREPFTFEVKNCEPEWVQSVQKQVATPLLDFKTQIIKIRKSKGHLTIRDITQVLYTFLENVKAYETLENLKSYNHAKGRLQAEKTDETLWGEVVNILERLVQILGDEKISLQEYAAILESSFGYVKMGMIPPAQDQVLIGTMERTRLPQIKALFVLGTNEGVIPKKEETSELFSEVDKVTIEKLCKGQDYKKDRLHDVLIQQPQYGATFTIYGVLIGATEKLFLSCVQADESGKALRPSGVFYKVQRLFKQSLEKKEDFLSHVVAKEPAFAYMATELKNYLENPQPSQEISGEAWKDLVNWYAKKPEWRWRLEQLQRHSAYTNQQEVLSEEVRPLLYKDRLETSISRLETFRSCPTCYFMKYGLKVSEREVLNFEMTDIGTLFHSVLEKYPKALEKRNTTWVDATLEQQTESIKEAVEMAFEKQNKTPYGLGRMRYTKAQVEKMSTRAIEALTYQLKQGEFEPVAYELTFGKNGFLPIEIALNDTQSLLIQGQIDRIDVYQKENERYVKIMDYKSGSQEFSLVEVYYGLQLQLLLYLDAYLKLNEGDLPAGVFYFHISGSTISYKANMTEEEIESKRQKNYKLSGLLLEDVEIAKKMEQEVMGEVIPATLKKESKSKKQQEPTFTATSSVASMAQFTVLRNHMVEILKSLGQEILSGRIVAKPYQYGTYTSCKYCDYLSVCQFDETQADNQVENLSKLKDKEVWQKLMPQEGGTADGMDDSATSGD